jgi:hypothetical protein
MSSLIGVPADRWSLSRAVDALADSARQAGRPGLVWFVGFLYPSLTFGIVRAPVEWSDDEGIRALMVGGSPLAGKLLAATCAGVCIGLFFFPVFRLVAGLARVSPPEAWREACGGRRTPRLRALWKNGAGMTLSTLGLWLQLMVMVAGALLLILLPAELASRWLVSANATPEAMRWVLAALLIGPIVTFFACYALAVAVLCQLALHSLAHNRRGVGSALLHGWRIMRHDPWATARAVLVDLVLTMSVLALWWILSWVVPVEWVGVVLFVLLTGFAGVARSGYWARAYRALGGLSPDDGVPGLQAA